jgi:hypothetical protein
VPHFRILVTGSIQRTEERREDFFHACENLGAAIANSGHFLCVLSQDENHADPHVFVGYAKQMRLLKSANPDLKIPKVTIGYGPLTDGENEAPWGHPKLSPLRDEYPELPIADLNTDEDYPFNRVAIVKQAIDLVVVIGGAEGAKQFVEIASALNKAVLPLPEFDGTAGSVWERQKSAIRLIAKSQDRIEDAIRDMTKSLKIGERIVLSKRSETSVSEIGLVATEALCLVLWFVFFLTGISHLRLSMGLLLLVSAVFGIMMRSLTQLLSRDAEPILAKRFLIELGLGVGLAFIYYVLFSLGGSSVAPDFKETLKNDHSFSSLAMIVSIIAFSVSFLLEDSLAKLTKKLEKVSG